LVIEADRKMIDHDIELSISRQCELLGKSRSWYYYKGSIDNIRIKRDNKDKVIISEILDKYPQYGYRKVSLESKDMGLYIKEKRTRRLMSEMGIKAVYPTHKISKVSKEDKKYPYLLKDIKIRHINQAWAADITYIKLPVGKVYLIAILDIYSRKILSWEISNTMDTQFCINALYKALKEYGRPEIFNTDQGSQFTSKVFTRILKKNKIKISMCSKGRALDNIYIERVWRTVKYEDIYLNNYETLKNLKKGVTDYFKFYNKKRFHQSLNYIRPDELYYGVKSLNKAA
jgi:putative transposase